MTGAAVDILRKVKNLPLPPNRPSTDTLSAPSKRTIAVALVPEINRVTAAEGTIVME